MAYHHSQYNLPNTPTSTIFTPSHSFSSPSQLSSPFHSPPDPASKQDGTHIDTLAARYATVQKLKRDFDMSTRQLLQANESFSSLITEMRALRDENRELQYQLKARCVIGRSLWECN